MTETDFLSSIEFHVDAAIKRTIEPYEDEVHGTVTHYDQDGTMLWAIVHRFKVLGGITHLRHNGYVDPEAVAEQLVEEADELLTQVLDNYQEGQAIRTLEHDLSFLGLWQQDTVTELGQQLVALLTEDGEYVLSIDSCDPDVLERLLRSTPGSEARRRYWSALTETRQWEVIEGFIYRVQ